MRSLLVNRSLLTALAAAIILISCKDNDTLSEQLANEGKKYPVNFNVVHGIGEETSGDVQNASLKQQLKLLYFLVYDKDGHRVKTIQQWSGQGDFGIIRDSLPEGHYTVIAAGENYTTTQRTYIDGDRFGISPSLPYDRAMLSSDNTAPELFTTEVFFRKFPLTVTPEDRRTIADVQIRRLVGRLEVNITDLPANSIFAINISNEYGRFLFAAEKPDTSYHLNGAEEWNPIRPSVNKGLVYVLNTIRPFDVTISGMDTSRRPWVAYTKTIRQVRCYPNKRTILTGNVFTNPDAIIPLKETAHRFSTLSSTSPEASIVLAAEQDPTYGVKTQRGWAKDSVRVSF